MLHGRILWGLLRYRSLVQLALEDGLDASEGDGLGGQGARARGFEPFRAVFLAQAHEPEASAEPLLRVGTCPQDGFHHVGGLGTGFLGPMHQPFRCPLSVVFVVPGHVG